MVEVTKPFEILDRAWKLVAALRGSMDHEPASSRLAKLRQQIRKEPAPHPVVFVDNLGSTLRDEVSELRKLPKEDYHDLLDDILEACLRCFDRVHLIWQNTPAYLKDTRAVWIACEPSLDLLQEEAGAYGLLKKQLKVCDEVIYFQSNPAYAKTLRTMLEADASFDNCLLSKLELVLLADAFSRPVALYISSGTKVRGYQASRHPPVVASRGKGFRLQEPLDEEWMSPLKAQDAMGLRATLSRLK